MHQHRKIGQAAAIAALILLASLIAYAFATEIPLTTRYIVLCLVDLLLFQIAVRLLGDVHAIGQIERLDTGHVRGVRETVDRLASVLKDAPR